jgi:hypothetical protein
MIFFLFWEEIVVRCQIVSSGFHLICLLILVPIPIVHAKIFVAPIWKVIKYHGLGFVPHLSFFVGREKRKHRVVVFCVEFLYVSKAFASEIVHAVVKCRDIFTVWLILRIGTFQRIHVNRWKYGSISYMGGHSSNAVKQILNWSQITSFFA